MEEPPPPFFRWPTQWVYIKLELPPTLPGSILVRPGGVHVTATDLVRPGACDCYGLGETRGHAYRLGETRGCACDCWERVGVREGDYRAGVREGGYRAGLREGGYRAGLTTEQVW